jgi:hypothetical protein
MQIDVDAATVERAFCDAQHIGSTTDATPVRATQDISPSVRRFVWRRDSGKCQTPGCRSARGIEIHHIVPRAEGGLHDPSNLHLRCSACHMATHRETLIVDGDRVVRPNAPSPVGPTRLDDAIVRTQARDALVALGFKATTARAAVDQARSHVGSKATLEEMIREALRRCPRPSS